MRQRVFSFALLLAMAISLLAPVLHVGAQGSAEKEARALLAKMTPEEKVGQLFLVTFPGTDVSQQSTIYDLIIHYHIGAALLSAANDNFVAAPDTLASANKLIAGLQEIEWANSQDTSAADSGTGEKSAYTYIPLFVGIEQPGDGLPHDQIQSGLSSVAPEMASGATWNPESAKQTGSVLGSELSALGFNLYLGPNLDVLTSPAPTTQGNQGTMVFGGDPFWVGTMGQAYIDGLHAGSTGRMAVIARNFPGRGEADRPPADEVSTVRKSLEQLKQIELAPFFAVTGNAPTSETTTDGLLVSHIRYQGFQGNIRATTRPVSFDSQALGQILGLDPLAKWREGGGIIVSDNLGSRAVRKFYDPSGQNFSALIVARDAFLAGNDLINLGGIVSTGDRDNYETVRKVLEFFAQKYREDTTFAKRVDESVLRLLTLKFKLYPDFKTTFVAPASGLDVLGTNDQAAITIANQSATLISPSSSDLSIVLPDAPAYRDRMIFFTDNRNGKQCSNCLPQPYLATDALMSTILRLYGPQGGDQIAGSHLSAYSFDDLAAILPGGAGNTDLENYIRQSGWVVFSTLELGASEPHADVLKRFLSERADLIRDKRVILFSFSAPYYLDATDISKITAYYGMYGKSQPFLDAAARILFKEIIPKGHLPVSVPGVGYDLITATSPDPDQVIQLSLDLPPVPTPEPGATPQPTPIPLYSEGNSISVRTGIVVDNNGNPVPDGTVVTFTETVEGRLYQQSQAETKAGIAATSFRLDKSGLVEIRAASEPANTSVVLQVDVTPGQAAAVTVIAPTPVATSVDTPSPAPTATTPQSGSMVLTSEGFPRLPSWVLAIFLLGVCGAITFISFSQIRSLQLTIRWTVCLILGGLAGYNYAALGFPGSKTWIESNGFSSILVLMLIGMGLGLLAAWLWELNNARLGKKQK